MPKKQKGKVCILACVFWPVYPGFGGRHAYNLARNLVEAGYEVDVVTTFPIDLRRRGNFFRQKPISRENLDGMRLLRVFSLLPTGPGIWRKFLFYVSFMFTSLMAIPFVGRTRFVVGLHPPITFLTPPGFIFSRLLRAKYIIRITDLWPDVVFDFDLARSRLLRRFVILVTHVTYRLAHHIMAFTPQIRDKILEQGIAADRVSLVEMAVDTSVFRPMSEASREADALGLAGAKGKFVALYAGAFALTYDFDVLLEAARILEGQSIAFVILGDGDAKEQIVTKINEYGLQNVIMPRPVSGPDEVAKYINCSDVCIIPLRAEMVTSTLTRPSKVFEFWACGKPVIACSSGDLEALIQESQAGIVLDPGNSEALADAIRSLHVDREAAEGMGERGREFVRNRFSYAALEANLKRMFELHIM
jgi:glycosyltransferase involved in cell wall biosynthesis